MRKTSHWGLNCSTVWAAVENARPPFDFDSVRALRRLWKPAHAAFFDNTQIKLKIHSTFSWVTGKRRIIQGRYGLSFLVLLRSLAAGIWTSCRWDRHDWLSYTWKDKSTLVLKTQNGKHRRHNASAMMIQNRVIQCHIKRKITDIYKYNPHGFCPLPCSLRQNAYRNSKRHSDE